MNNILKYQVTQSSQEIEVPSNFTILHVDSQREIPCIWLKGSFGLSKTRIKIVVLNTGDEIGESWQHIGTVKLALESIIKHLFIIP